MSAPAHPSTPLVLGPHDGRSVNLLALGVRFMVGSDETDGHFALVEHPLPPRALGAPLHTHRNEDERSYVLAGTIGAQVGDEVLVARAGDLLFKPRGVPHAFWNAGDEPALLLEMITPGGFERYFAEAAELLPQQGAPDFEQRFGALLARYDLDLDFSSIPGLVERHGLVMPD